MSKPDDIPQDVWDKATEWMDASYLNGGREVVARAILAERYRIADRLDEEAEVTPCFEDAVITRSNADLVRANFSYDDAEKIAAARDAGVSDFITAIRGGSNA
tara:strand:- start:19965 stop:20273 length:309 start_codon:yes stop_codon:yes gene_type:complete